MCVNVAPEDLIVCICFLQFYVLYIRPAILLVFVRHGGKTRTVTERAARPGSRQVRAGRQPQDRQGARP